MSRIGRLPRGRHISKQFCGLHEDVCLAGGDSQRAQLGLQRSAFRAIGLTGQVTPFVHLSDALDPAPDLLPAPLGVILLIVRPLVQAHNLRHEVVWELERCEVRPELLFDELKVDRPLRALLPLTGGIAVEARSAMPIGRHM
ncbi:MAG: hypothetical protein U0075_23565 [Thermomicrobiales bacterium]